jgi:hypothetical protein
MSTGGDVRRVLARIVAVAAAVFWGFLFFGLIDLLTPFVEGEDFAAHYLMETGWGLTYLVLVAVPLLALVVRPGSLPAVLELGAVGIALVVGAVLAGSTRHLLPGLGVLATAAVLAFLGRPISGALQRRPAPLAGGLALVATVPAAAYAWDMARATENPEETWGLDHYPVQAAFAIAVVLVALVCATTRPGPGSWLTASTAAVCAIWIGVLSMVWPERLGSLGTGWGAVAVGWGVALLGAATLERQRVRLTGSLPATPAG